LIDGLNYFELTKRAFTDVTDESFRSWIGGLDIAGISDNNEILDKFAAMQDVLIDFAKEGNEKIIIAFMEEETIGTEFKRAALSKLMVTKYETSKDVFPDIISVPKFAFFNKLQKKH